MSLNGGECSNMHRTNGGECSNMHRTKMCGTGGHIINTTNFQEYHRVYVEQYFMLQFYGIIYIWHYCTLSKCYFIAFIL